MTQDREYLYTRSFAFIEDELIQYGFTSSEIYGDYIVPIYCYENNQIKFNAVSRIAKILMKYMKPKLESIYPYILDSYFFI